MIGNNSSAAASATYGGASGVVSAIDAGVWRAVAGMFVHVPAEGSRVYYFPQGHFEQCLSATSSTTILTTSAAAGGVPFLSPPPVFTSPPPAYFHCRVVSVKYLFHPETDQPFASIHLVPIPLPFPSAASDVSNGGCINNNDVVVDDVSNGGCSRNGVVDDVSSEVVDEDDIASFTKVLTPSDANNGGGFSVPRFCADSVFPPLDFYADPPVQYMVMRDMRGESYNFRHIYRGTPRRHLLTTGWSKFVNDKKLVAGDSVVFMRRRSTGELFVGVRRAIRGEWNCGSDSVKVEKSEEDDWTIGKGVVVDAVLEALEKAVRGMEFEVVFYPRPGWSEFIVKGESVDKSMGVLWTSGMRVKMPMATEDSTRTTWYHGTVSSASMPRSGPWQGSPWRMLEITWDEPDILKHLTRANPWQVEHVVHSSPLHAAFPPTKRFKAWEDFAFLPSGGELTFSMMGFSNSMIGPPNPSYSGHTFFPAGMQGARQNQECGYFISEFLQNGIQEMKTEEVTDNNLQWKSETLSTELNIGSLPSDTSSVDNSNNSFNGTVLEWKQDSSSSPKKRKRTFQLFGKIIGIEKPAEDSGGIEECSF